MIKIRKVNIKDFKQINKLFANNNLKFISLSTWKSIWKSPYPIKRKPTWTLGWVFLSNKNIIGYIGNYPSIYIFKKKEFICSILNSWVVEKKFRNLSVLLMKEFLKQNSSNLFLSTTTSSVAANIMEKFDFKPFPEKKMKHSLFFILNTHKFVNFFMKKFKFFNNNFLAIILAKFINLIFKNKINYWKKTMNTNSIKKINKFDQKYEFFWKNYIKENSNKMTLSRNSQWQNWRLQNLIKAKKAFILVFERNKKIVGYSCSTIIKKGPYKVAKLIDIITLDKSEDIFIKLIKANILEAEKKQCIYFEHRNFAKKNFELISQLKPFNTSLKNNSFFYKKNDNKIKNSYKVSNIWEPSNLDGDIIFIN